MIERYARPEMGNIWNDQFKLETWLKVEILACEVRAEMGDIPRRFRTDKNESEILILSVF